jgi:hypothetical protein
MQETQMPIRQQETGINKMWQEKGKKQEDKNIDFELALNTPPTLSRITTIWSAVTHP